MKVVRVLEQGRKTDYSSPGGVWHRHGVYYLLLVCDEEGKIRFPLEAVGETGNIEGEYTLYIYSPFGLWGEYTWSEMWDGEVSFSPHSTGLPAEASLEERLRVLRIYDKYASAIAEALEFSIEDGRQYCLPPW